jgi:hypothetical protein
MMEAEKDLTVIFIPAEIGTGDFLNRGSSVIASDNLLTRKASLDAQQQHEGK